MRNDEDPAKQAIDNWEVQMEKIIFAFPALTIEDLFLDEKGFSARLDDIGLKIGRTRQELVDILNNS